MPRKPREVLLRESKKYKATKKKPVKPKKKDDAKSAKVVYKKASNGRGYKIVDNKVRFVSAKEFAENSK